MEILYEIATGGIVSCGTAIIEIVYSETGIGGISVNSSATQNIKRDFKHEASSGIRMFGHALCKKTYIRYHQYQIGSILFAKHKAIRGVYEKIAIKRIKFPNRYVNLYVDTFNGLWNENELIPYESAVVLVDRYIERRNAWLEEIS
jgi:hypothetical protein